MVSRRKLLQTTAIGTVGIPLLSEGVQAAEDQRSISYGQTVQGEIESSDPEGYRGYYEPVAFEGSRGETVTITMTSSDDTYLKLLDPSGAEVAEDDDGASGFDSRIEAYELQSSGQYTIIATSYNSEDFFEYELTLEQVETQQQGGADVRSVSYGQTVRGEIDRDDPQGYRGYYEPIPFDGVRGETVSISMTSRGDTYLKLLDPSGAEVAEDDDGGDGLDSRIEEYQLLSSGQYTIIATSYDRDDTFEYDLTLERVTTQQRTRSDVRSISYGQMVRGRIDRNDPQGYRGYYEPVSFRGSQGDTITITMQSADDAYLKLLDPFGNEVAEDDDSGDGLNSRIDSYDLQSSGQYTIVVTSYSSDDTFAYDLTLEADATTSFESSSSTTDGSKRNATNSTNSGGQEAAETESGGVNVEVPGFGIGEALAAIGGAGYMVKRRLTEDE